MRTLQLATRPIRILAAPLRLARVIAGVSSRRGRSRLRVLAAAAAGVVVVVSLGLSATPVAAVAVSITLKPAAGPPTSAVTVTGAGFGASETVAVDFSAAQVATATTSSAGTFSATFTVPASALPGRHPVTATGETSGLSATQNFLVRTNWPEFHFDAASTGFNPYENVIGPSNVSQLKTAWTTGGATSDGIGSSPAVANGVVYVGSVFDNLYAFSATGTSGCSGTPKTCTPLWTGTTDPIEGSSAAMANGVVYIASDDNTLYAFSTAVSTANCSGTPKTCTPLWTASIPGVVGSTSSPVVANGVVYVAGGGTLYAFSTAVGSPNCSGTPTTCTPLWTTTKNATNDSSPAVANGVVYVASQNDTLEAFSTTVSSANCSGTPTTCTPLWTGPSPGGSNESSPAVANGVVYVGNGSIGLDAFSTTVSSANCSGTPTTCTALWTGTASNLLVNSAPAVANGVVYATSDGGSKAALYAFSATAKSAHCSGTPPNKTCTPLWTAGTSGGVTTSPAVAYGVVYIGDAGQIYAFSASGTTGCSGTPTACAPLWTGTTTGNVTLASPAVANGVVYEGQWDSHAGLYAYKP